MARPFRYNFIVALVALSTGLAAAGGWRYARASAPVNGPIIVISIDALRADHLPAYGYRKVRTPAIDQLAADGIVFERAYSHAPETLPAHASLLSGRLPFETGVRDNAGFTIKSTERLLAEMLRDRGYATGGIVSTFMLGRNSGIGQGFTFFDDKMAPAAPDMTVGELDRDPALSEQIAERWLNKTGTERSFLFLHLSEARRPSYDAEISYADEIVGRLFRYLKTHQLYDQSTIVLVSGHGEGLGDHGEQKHGLFVYEETLHVPLIVKQAAGENAGRRVKDVVQHVDVVPTILDFAKAPIPANLSGRSLKALLDGAGGLADRSIYSESLYGRYHFGWAALTTITDGRYRYIKAPREELYDLQQDPGERHNLAADSARAETVNALRTRLERLTGRTSAPAPGVVAPGDRERLEASGFVGQFDAAAGQDAKPADPKDEVQVLEAYRAASDLAVRRQWTSAIERFKTLLGNEPDLIDVWRHVGVSALRSDRAEDAVDAFKRVTLLKPDDPTGHLDAANALIRFRRFDEARQQAELAESIAPDGDIGSRAFAHELLVRIALARHDAAAAREQATLANQVAPESPLPDYVEARLLYDQGRYAAALPLFERAVARRVQNTVRPIEGLHFYTADTLSRLDRAADAETEFWKELEAFPQSTRARVGLATLYHEAGRTDEAAGAVADLIRVSPTTEGYLAASRLLGSLGNREQSVALRAQARRIGQ